MPESTAAQEMVAIWPFLVYAVLVLIVLAGTIVLSSVVGERHRAPGKDVPYESGMNPTGNARVRYGVHFYSVAVFFVLFDVETAFLYAWAAAFRESGWAGTVEALLFILVLFLGLVYVWKMGGLDWSPSRRAARREGRG